MDNLTKTQRSKNMRAIKSGNTKIEVILRLALANRGLRYRLNYTNIPGKPDIAFPGRKIAVFCDSEFWHGYRWAENQRKILSNRDYWIPKIERNISRDREINRLLRKQGWTVLRFWGREILMNPSKCADRVEKTLARRKSSD